VLTCRSSCCPHQYNNIFQSCYHARHLAALSASSYLELPCTSSRCPQYSIFQPCYHEYHLAVLSSTVDHISFVLPCISSLRYSIFPRAIMHITSRPHPDRESLFCATMHIISLPSVLHLFFAQPSKSSRCPQQYSIFQSYCHALLYMKAVRNGQVIFDRLYSIRY
jgi:hypothetical protein